MDCNDSLVSILFIDCKTLPINFSCFQRYQQLILTQYSSLNQHDSLLSFDRGFPGLMFHVELRQRVKSYSDLVDNLLQ